MSKFRSSVSYVLSVCFYAVIFSLLSAGLSAQDTGSGLVFTGCPPYVEGNHCDSMFYQVVAVDIGTGKKCPHAKYFIVSGPGEINQKTGLWQFHPEKEDLPAYYYEELEIAAYKGNDTTTSDENCRFMVQIYDSKPRFDGYCGAHITVLSGESMVVPLAVTDEDYCHDPEITSVEIHPTPSGSFDYDSEIQSVTFEPAPADSGITYEVVLSGQSGPGTINCRFWFDCSEPEPIKIRLESVAMDEARPGDTVSVDLVVDDCPADLELAEFLITFDSRLLEYTGATPGAAFFDPDTGCGWLRLDDHGSFCYESGQMVLGLRAQARGSSRDPLPACYRPDEFPAVLATLQFVVAEQIDPGQQFAKVDFYWCDCRDNFILSPNPRVLFSTSQVTTAGGLLIEPTGLPGMSGASDECFYFQQGSYERYRNVWYQNGGVDLTMPQPPGKYSLRLGTKHDQFQGHFTDLPITLEATDSTQGFGGFDLLFGYDASALVFQLATGGDLYDSCGWEYFTYRYGGYSNCGGACPSGMLRVVGLAETNNGQPTAGCDEPYPGNVQPDQLPITLAYLRFLVSNDRNIEGTFIPVSFFWYDCTDNLLSNYDGYWAMLSSRVFDENDSLISRESEFPTWFGTKEECIDSNSHGGERIARRCVDYHNGGVQIHLPEPIDVRGDINLNGLAFEIADGVMFSNYFISGLSAFGNHVEGSIAASDCNGDGIPLTVADYVYLYRWVIGEPPTCTYGDSSTSIARFSQDETGVISVATLDSLGAVHLVVEGEVVVSLLAEQMDMKFSYWTDSGVTSILVYSFGDNQFLIAGPIISLSAPANIVDVSTATFAGCPVESVIDPPSQPAPYAVQIGYLPHERQGYEVTVPIILHAIDPDHGLAGFDFLIGYSTSALAFMGGLQGDLYDSCGWEYFTFRYEDNGNCGDACPTGLVRLVGIAETNNGPIYAGCNNGHVGFVDTTPITIASMSFLTSNDRRFENQHIPVRFFWRDCSDNVLVSHDGWDVYLADQVFDFYDFILFWDYEITGLYEFPTYGGTRETLLAEGCYSLDTANSRQPRPNVRFQNGGVSLSCDSIDARGDINLNGIKFEMFDAIMFADYFTQGFAAFGNHIEGSIAASDCNSDGIALGVDDFIYVVRTVLGDAEPYDRGTPSPNPAYFHLDPLDQEVVVTTAEHLGAVQMVVNGEVTPQLLADQMEISFAWDSGLTRILIYSFEPNVYLEAGRLVTLPGVSGIVEVETATFLGRRIMSYAGEPSDVDDPSSNLPNVYALHQNYPNPFNPTTMIDYDLPKSSTVRLDIYNITGQKVRTLVSDQLGAGHQSVEWDGRDGSGRRVSTGIYLYRLTAGEFVQTRKMLLLK